MTHGFCKREGCPRVAKTTRADGFCTFMCKDIENEMNRLQGLYEAAGDPTLDKAAWVEFAAFGDAWTECMRLRGALVKEIRSKGLPLPA